MDTVDRLDEKDILLRRPAQRRRYNELADARFSHPNDPDRTSAWDDYTSDELDEFMENLRPYI